MALFRDTMEAQILGCRVCISGAVCILRIKAAFLTPEIDKSHPGEYTFFYNLMETIPQDKIIHDEPRDLNACIHKVRQLSNCIEIANLINSELSLGRLLSNVMETVKQVFSADSASLLLREEETGDLVFQIALGDVGDEIREIYRLKKGQGIAGAVAETGTPVNVADAYDHPNFSPDYDRRTHYRTKAMLCVPLKARGQTLGVIQVINKLTPPHRFTQEDLEMLLTIASSAAVAVDTARMHRFIIQKETLERDLSLAREVQQSFLPGQLPRLSGYNLAALNRPALEIGGDFYNFFQLPDQRLGIVVGDVSGKGIAAALFMARLTSDIQYHSLLCHRPQELLARVNDLLCQRAKHGMFVTLVYLILNPFTGRITFANAGHHNPVCSGEGKAITLGSDDAKGPPLGIIPGSCYTDETLTLNPGQTLSLYTDGITEAKNSNGDLFGDDRLMDVMAQTFSSARDLVTSVSSAVDKFSLDHGPSDDITMVSVMRREAAP